MKASTHYILGLSLILSLGTFVRIEAGVVTEYYRFDEGTGSNVTDSVDGLIDGTHNAIYSTNVPVPIVPQTGEADNFSLQFTGTNVARFASQDFIFNSAFGNATLEFWINVPQEVHTTIFWTRPDDSDANRFNISINPNGNLGFDYRSPTGVLHTMLLGGTGEFVIPLNTWTHVAITRTVDSPTVQTYRFYENGTLDYTATDMNPDLPTTTTWTIADRTPGIGATKFVGYLDEIRFADTVLAPNQFLDAPVPEPGSLLIWAVGMIGCGAVRVARRKQSLG